MKIDHEMMRRMMEFLPTIQMYHWRTFSHARHVASGELYEKMTSLLDEFVEVYMGLSGKRPLLDARHNTLTVKTFTEKKIVSFLTSYVSYLSTLNLPSSDLLNIRDEMLAILNRTIYLFSQK